MRKNSAGWSVFIGEGHQDVAARKLVSKLFSTNEEFFRGSIFGLEYIESKVAADGGIREHIELQKRIISGVEPIVAQGLADCKNFLVAKANSGVGLTVKQKQDLADKYWQKAQDLAASQHDLSLRFALTKEIDPELRAHKLPKILALQKLFKGTERLVSQLVNLIGAEINNQVITKNSVHHHELLDVSERLDMAYVSVNSEQEASLSGHRKRSEYMAEKAKSGNSTLIVGMSHLVEINDYLRTKAEDAFSYIIIGDDECRVSFIGHDNPELLERFREAAVTFVDIRNFKQEADIADEAYDRAAAFVMQDIEQKLGLTTSLSSVREAELQRDVGADKEIY